MYSKATRNSTTSEFPPIVAELIENLKSKIPDAVVTQCTINEMEPAGAIPEHSDNEASIVPDSAVYTFCIGGPRPIKFRSRFNRSSEVSHVANNRSLYVMSRESQNYWTHRVDALNDEEAAEQGKRYSVTLRHVDPHFLRSLLVIGDSNARKFKFGEDKGTLGIWTPGKVVYTPTVDDIDPVCCNAGSYRNVMIHVGINDLKTITHPSQIIAVTDKLISKCRTIISMNPAVKLYVSPVLPTRDMGMNKKAMFMNRRIQACISETFLNINILDYTDFVDERGLLRYNLCSNFNNDPIHLGGRGIAKMVTVIKRNIHKIISGNVTNQRHSMKVDGRPYTSVSNVNRGSVNMMMPRGSVNMMMPQYTTSNKFTSYPLLS